MYLSTAVNTVNFYCSQVLEGYAPFANSPASLPRNGSTSVNNRCVMNVSGGFSYSATT